MVVSPVIQKLIILRWSYLFTFASVACAVDVISKKVSPYFLIDQYIMFFFKYAWIK